MGNFFGGQCFGAGFFDPLPLDESHAGGTWVVLSRVRTFTPPDRGRQIMIHGRVRNIVQPLRNRVALVSSVHVAAPGPRDRQEHETRIRLVVVLKRQREACVTARLRTCLPASRDRTERVFARLRVTRAI